MKSQSLPFTKLEAAGNDFVLIQANPRQAPDLQGSLQEFCQRVCALHTGVCADGLIFVWPERKDAPTQRDQAWHWRFFNSDGSEASMCGNAARGVTRWFGSHTPNENEFEWQGERVRLRGHVAGTDSNPAVTWPIEERRLDVADSLLSLVKEACKEAGLSDAEVALIDSGVPHLVLASREIWPAALRARHSAALRGHASLGSAGANVTFVGTESGEAVTFERGVEGETLACGSGALAAYLAVEKAPSNAARTFSFPGGPLTVRRSEGALWLSGPARIVFTGEYFT